MNSGTERSPYVTDLKYYEGTCESSIRIVLKQLRHQILNVINNKSNFVAKNVVKYQKYKKNGITHMFKYMYMLYADI